VFASFTQVEKRSGPPAVVIIGRLSPGYWFNACNGSQVCFAINNQPNVPMENKRHSAQWENHLLDERLAVQEYAALWLAHMDDHRRLDIAAAAMGWKKPVAPSESHPDSYQTDPEVIVVRALLEELANRILSLSETGAIGGKDVARVMRQVLLLQHRSCMLLQEALDGELYLAETLFPVIQSQARDLSRLLGRLKIGASEKKVTRLLAHDIQESLALTLQRCHEEEAINNDEDDGDEDLEY